MKKTYNSEAAAAIHEMAAGLTANGLMPKKTMREIDALCLTPVEELTPDEIKAIREEAHASQSVFARHLNVSASVVSQWERGERTPSGSSLKLLCMVKKKGLEYVV